MRRGSSIRIFLADGTVTGIRHAEVVNWTGQAIACPRSRVVELSEWDEAGRPGVYLLFGTDESSAKPAVYVGEAENVWTRLQSHLAGKDFWNEVIVFTNKDENLTKAHVRYLESRVYETASSIGRYRVVNANTPQQALLPRGDRDSMESFIEQIRVLLGVLGHRVLEPLAPQTLPGAAAPNPQVANGGATAGTALKLSVKDVHADALLTDEGIVVRAGSMATNNPADSLGGTYKKLRDQLKADGVLIPDNGRLRFAADYLFTSPSAAACVALGYSVNGRAVWKTADGKSINDLESAGGAAAAMGGTT